MTAASLLGLLALALVMLPYGVQWYLESWLRDRGVTNVSIGDVDINPFTGTFAIQSLEYEDDGATRRAGQAAINLEWVDLVNRRIRLTTVELRDAALEIRRTESNRWLLGTIVLGAQEAVQEAERSETETGWGFGIDRLQFENIKIDYRDPLIVRDFSVESASLSDFATWDPQQSTRMALALSAGDERLSASGTARPFAEVFDLDLQVDGEKLDAGGLDALLAQAGVESVEGLLYASFRVRVVAPPAGGDTKTSIDGSVTLEQWELVRPQDRVALNDLGWKGVLDLTTGNGGQKIETDGELTLSAGEVALTEPGVAIDVGTLSWRGQLAQTAGADISTVTGSGDLGLSGLSVELAATQTGSGEMQEAISAGLAGLELNISELSLDTGTTGLDAAWKGKLSLQDLGLEMPAAHLALASVNLDGSVTAKEADGGQIMGLQGAFDASGLGLQDVSQDLVVRLDSLKWQGGAEASASQGRLTSADGEIVASQISARPGQMQKEQGQGDTSGEQLLQVSELRAALTNARADEILSLDSVNLSGIDLLKRSPASSDEPGHTVSLSAIAIDGIGVGDDTFSLGKILLSDLQVWIERLSTGAFEFDNAAVDASGEGGDAGTAAAGDDDAVGAAEESPAPTFSLAGLSLSGDSRVTYVDRSVKPVARLQFSPLDLEVGPVDAASPDSDTPITIATALGRYGKLNFAGQLRPLAAQTYVVGDGEIKALDMIMLDGFARRAIGYAIKSGTLSADLSVDLQNQQLDSLADLTIRKLDIDPLKPDEQDEFSTELGVPLETALGMLEDNQETIRLEVPLKGDVSDLSVGVGDALRIVMNKGLMAGMKTAATTYFAPLWPALAVGKLFEVASALRFESITFQPGETVPGPEAGAYLQEIAGLLASRNKVSLDLCGRAVAADLRVLYPEAEGDLNDEQREALVELARGRNEAVKDQLIDAGIESSRLVTCKPEASPADDGLPRVEFGA